METMKNLMENLRKAPPAEIAGFKVVKAVDYKADGTGLPKANVLEYRLEGGAKFMVRPSGTEPKIKTYLSAVGKTEAEATAINARMAEAAKEMMKG
jgi:phosphoglucomutase